MAARHLGQFNGHYLGEQPVPSFSWLSRHIVGQWVAGFPAVFLPYFCDVQSQPNHWDHPLVLRRYPSPDRNPFRHMLLERDRIVSLLDHLPQTLCHGDTYPTNLMLRRTPDNQEVTAVLDWALTGVGPVGSDPGHLVLGACDNLQDLAPTEIEATLFENYLHGLQESGCRVDPLQVRLGFTASAALHVGLFHLWLLNEAIQQAALDSTALATMSPDQGGARAPFKVRMADEAYMLLGSIGRNS